LCPSDTSTHHSAPAARGATGTDKPAPFEPRRLWSLRVDEESAPEPVPVCVGVIVWLVVVVWAVAQSHGRRVSKPGRGAMTARASAEAAESASAVSGAWDEGRGGGRSGAGAAASARYHEITSLGWMLTGAEERAPPLIDQ
jgi:hypothetical protein